MENTTASPAYLTSHDVARTLQVCARTVHRLIKRGELIAVVVGRCTRIPATGLDAYLARNTRNPKATPEDI